MEPPTFSAIDVETANADPASICQIGIVHVRAGTIRAQWQSLVNPETQFHSSNFAIHGINEETVRCRPKLPDVYEEIAAQIEGAILVSHTSYDRIALDGPMRKYRLPPITGPMARQRHDRTPDLAAAAEQRRLVACRVSRDVRDRVSASCGGRRRSS